MTAYAVTGADGLAPEITAGAGAVIVAEEALSEAAFPALSDAFRAQPAWSDLPLILLTTTGESNPQLAARLDRLAHLGAVTLIERPVRPGTLISVVEVALRARGRQYEVERLLNEVSIAEHRLRSIIESAQDYAIIHLDLDGRVSYWNSGAAHLLGYSEAEMLGAKVDRLFPVEQREGAAHELDTALREGRSVEEGWRLRRDGSKLWASGVVSLTRDAQGRPIGFVKVLRDMTVRKTAEERLAAQTRALQQSNEDLQRFAYAASHDLQEPLRTVSSYSQLLARRNTSLDSDSQEFIRFIVAGVDRMRGLIKDLLDFSRATSELSRPAEPVDATGILGLALQHLQFKISETQASITFDRLPVVLAHDGRLLVVFQNLIDNAIKYCQERPVIHIWAEPEDSFWRISVRDNGIGIAREYHQKIFGLFERLHSRAEYPGTGIGLATCKRIVEREGGWMGVESEPGKGSVFYFTLPAP